MAAAFVGPKTRIPRFCSSSTMPSESGSSGPTMTRVGLLLDGDSHQGVQVRERHRNQARKGGDAAVAGGADHFRDTGRAGGSPGKGMFTASRAVNKHFHTRRGRPAAMAEELKSYATELERTQRRAEQRRLFRRNQAIGLLLLAAAVLAWGMLRAPQGWLFPPGWWRFW
jgi:hypothetical protein